jgi:hypothetical protein
MEELYEESYEEMVGGGTETPAYMDPLFIKQVQDIKNQCYEHTVLAGNPTDIHSQQNDRLVDYVTMLNDIRLWMEELIGPPAQYQHPPSDTIPEPIRASLQTFVDILQTQPIKEQISMHPTVHCTTIKELYYTSPFVLTRQ